MSGMGDKLKGMATDLAGEAEKLLKNKMKG